jgi:crossover junction endodeoxyribonuclease RuvC
MIILGLDPALRNTGWGVIKAANSSVTYVASGTISTNSDETLSKRLAYLSTEISKILNEFNPEIASIEETFINMNPASSIKLAHARGAIITTIGLHSIPLKEFAPNSVKKTIVGSGRAAKEQVLYMVNMLMPTAKITNLDAADALAVAYTCFAF